MVECLNQDKRPLVRASPASECCGPWARHIYPSLVLVQPRKTRPCFTERLLMGRKESNKTNNISRMFEWMGFIFYTHLSHYITSRSDIMPCFKINKPLVVYLVCSVSARVRFMRFWRNKLTADALTVCLCFFRDAHKNSSENETPSSLCA